jgi:hypothetical protein
MSSDAKKCADEIQLLQKEFNSRFQNIRKCVVTINLFSMPFCVHVENIPAKFQMEVLGLRCDTDLRNAFRHLLLLQFYKMCLIVDSFLVLSGHVRGARALFRSTCDCEYFFSKMKVL